MQVANPGAMVQRTLLATGLLEILTESTPADPNPS